MKGIVLAGGSGTRLYPITKGISKQLVPIYDKPMVYYPLSVLIGAGIDEILIITTPHDVGAFRRLLGTGAQWGIELSYRIQEEPRGLAEAFIIGADFIGNDSVTLVLGDNIFDGRDFCEGLASHAEGGQVFAYEVKDPQRYGVVSFDAQMNVHSIEEKPSNPKSNFAVVGLYQYSCDVVEIARSLQPSARGELEITDVNSRYLEAGQLKVHTVSNGNVWLDTGTFDSMSEASSYVEVVQKRTGIIIGSPEVASFQSGFITLNDLEQLGEAQKKSGYGDYLLKIARQTAW